MRTFLHATFSPSDKAWLNYDREKIRQRVLSARAVQRGTELHELAKHCIDMRTPLDPSNGIISVYVKDCIAYEMDTEVSLMYSEDIGGTADALKFDMAEGILRISDLKTGERKASIAQVVLYAALWCLINRVDPMSIGYDLRIYGHTSQRLASGFEKEDEELVCEKVNDAAVHIKYVQSVIDEISLEGLI